MFTDITLQARLPGHHSLILFIIIQGGSNNANGIAIDGSGDLYITDPYNGYVWEYSASSGATSVITRGLNGPTGIQVDGSGNVYVVELNARTLKKFTSAGVLTATLLSGFNSPYSLYVDLAGNYYIGGSTAPGAVSEYSSSGLLIQTVTTTLGSPRGIVVDGSGNLFVSDFTNNKVVEYTPTYYTISPSVTTGNPGLSFDPITGKVYRDANCGIRAGYVYGNCLRLRACACDYNGDHILLQLL